jgi:molybdopterin molybdotransferase
MGRHSAAAGDETIGQAVAEKPRKATVEEHAALIRSLVTVQPRVETLPLSDALGRVTASAVPSPVDLPLFRNSQMDGFAVRAADLRMIPVTLPVAGAIPASAATPPPLVGATAVRIMTGAVIPDGADAIVPVEDTVASDGSVTITRTRVSGDYVRERGSDLRAGDPLLPAGLRLGSRHLAVLAAAGLSSVDVRAKTRVAIITTGAELVAPGAAPLPGQIFDANGVALVAAVSAAGAAVTYTARVTDTREEMLAALTEACAAADIVVTSGGISMGDYEVVRETLEPLGATVTTIAMQPGGPQATALIDGVPVLSFPGNPVSTQVSFELFLAPILRHLSGMPAALRERRVLAVDVTSVEGKRQFLRGRALPNGGVELVGGASSHLVAGLAASDLLVDIPAETIQLMKGDTVETVIL